MITVALTTRIAASAEDVWRALTDPREREIWDERILGVITMARRQGETRGSRGETPPERVRWRFALAGIPQVLQDDRIEEDRLERIVSRIAIGSMHFDQTLTLFSETGAEDDGTGPYTRLGMKLSSRNQVAVIGEFIQRSDVQRIVLEYVDTTLRQVQKYCES